MVDETVFQEALNLVSEEVPVFAAKNLDVLEAELLEILDDLDSSRTVEMVREDRTERQAGQDLLLEPQNRPRVIEKSEWSEKWRSIRTTIEARAHAKQRSPSHSGAKGKTSVLRNLQSPDMGKPQNNEGLVKVRTVRTSPQKLNFVAGLIRGKKVGQALADLTLSETRVTEDVKKRLQSAIANAESNHNVDVDELIIAKAYVRKESHILKRGRPRVRGRSGRVIKTFNEITIKLVEENEGDEVNVGFTP